jgi:hypothetical protein
MVVLTNGCCGNSAFYVCFIKYADFYPVADGIENSIEPLSRLVGQGYSIMIFPEGTRSEDCSINRFHKGAFYLAEKLNLDLLPIIIHGIGHVLPKTDFLLRKGAVRVEILDRITPINVDYGETYSLRAKFVRKMYSSYYKKLASEIETPEYYADKLFHNYIYKGTSVSSQVQIDLKKHRCYCEIIKRLPDIGNLLVLGSGLGSLPLMLSMLKPDLTICSVEADEDKLALAQNCASATKKISYINYSPLYFKTAKSFDVVIMLDFFSTIEDVGKMLILENCLLHSNIIILSDIEYNWLQKMQLKLTGSNLYKVKNIDKSELEQLSKELHFGIIHQNNIYTLSKVS